METAARPPVAGPRRGLDARPNPLEVDKALRRVDADQPGPQRIADVEAFDAAHQAALHRRPGDAHDVLFIGFAIASDLRGWFAVAGWR